MGMLVNIMRSNCKRVQKLHNIIKIVLEWLSNIFPKGKFFTIGNLRRVAIFLEIVHTIRYFSLQIYSSEIQQLLFFFETDIK